MLVCRHVSCITVYCLGNFLFNRSLLVFAGMTRLGKTALKQRNNPLPYLFQVISLICKLFFINTRTAPSPILCIWYLRWATTGFNRVSKVICVCFGISLLHCDWLKNSRHFLNQSFLPILARFPALFTGS